MRRVSRLGPQRGFGRETLRSCLSAHESESAPLEQETLQWKVEEAPAPAQDSQEGRSQSEREAAQELKPRSSPNYGGAQLALKQCCCEAEMLTLAAKGGRFAEDFLYVAKSFCHWPRLCS